VKGARPIELTVPPVLATESEMRACPIAVYVMTTCAPLLGCVLLSVVNLVTEFSVAIAESGKYGSRIEPPQILGCSIAATSTRVTTPRLFTATFECLAQRAVTLLICIDGGARS
jgi:hypothetical protein